MIHFEECKDELEIRLELDGSMMKSRSSMTVGPRPDTVNRNKESEVA